MATLDEIIKKQKEHLTKAQIKSLSQAVERYKQLTNAQRAEAYSGLHRGLISTRRGLQNVGLAARRGKLISGAENAADINAQDVYGGYNAGLDRVANAYTEQAAARMARETAIQEHVENLKQQQEKIKAEAEKVRKEYERARAAQAAAERARQAAELERERANQEQFTDPRLNLPKPTLNQYKQPVRAAQPSSDVDPRFASPIAAPDKAIVADYRHYMDNVERFAREQQQYEQAKQFVSSYKPMSPRDYIGRRKYAEAKDIINNYEAYVNGDRLARFAVEYKVDLDKVRADDPTLAKTISDQADYWYKLIDANEQNWNRAITEKTPDEKSAYERKANAYSNLARLAAAAKAPKDQRKLYMMTDDEFNVAFDAAEHAYKMAAQYAKIARDDSSDNMDDVTSDAYAEESEAMQRFAIFERVKRDRADNSDISYLSESMPIPESDKVKDKEYDSTVSFVYQNQQNWRAVPWARMSEWNGQNWKEAYNRKWDASDYSKDHDTKGSKYAALVNEWAFINGRTALLYSQKFQGTQFFGNIKDLIGSVFGGDINRDSAYKWFRDSCVMAFRGDWETSGTSSQKEQMDAMLTLANLMTDEERARFNALLDNIGASAADKYFKMLYTDVLPERFASYVQGEEAFDTRDAYGKVMQSIASVPVNLAQGIPGVVHTLKTSQDDPVAARLAATKYTTAQNMRNAVSKDFGRFGQFAYGTGMSMADSATVAMISSGIGGMLEGVAGMSAEVAGKVGSTIGGALLGASAFNASYKEAIERGLSPDEARATAIGNGINEMLFEAVSLDMLVGHFQKGGILKVSKNGFVNWLVNTLVQGGVEGSEEVFTDIGNNVWDKLFNGVYAEEVTKLREYVADGMSFDDAKKKVSTEYAEQLGMSFLGGFVSGGVMGGGATFLGMVQNRGNENLGAGLRQNERVVNELRNFDFKSEYAKEILQQKNLTNADIADLFNIMQQELLGQYKSDIQKAVADGKITQEQADLLNKYEQNGVQIVKDGDVIANENGITNEQMPSVQDAIANLDNAARIQFLNNEEMRSLVQAVGGETAAVIEQSETAERDAEKAYRQTVREINNDTTLSPELKQKRLEAAERTRQNARSEASKIADTALTNKKGIGAKLETDGNGTVKVGKGSGKVTYDFSTKDNPGHQTVDSMTATEQSALRIAKIVAASRPDVNVKVEAEFGVDENGIDHSKENGYYNRNTNTIHINMSGDNSVLWTLSHELTHHLANTDTKAYAALRTAIETALKDSKLTTTELEDRGFEYDLDRVDPYIAREGNLWDALVAFEREEHGYGKDAEEEVVARCCESFLGFDQFVKDFARKQYKSAKAINKFIAQMNIDMQRVSEDARQSAAQRNVWNDESPENQILRQLTEIDRIANLWRIAVNAEAKKRQAAREETRASTKDSVQMENRINKLREEIASIENDSERLFTNGREFDNARLKKLKNELNALIEQERKASVKTSLSDILANLDLYRRSDLISMAGQLTQAWDDVDEMTTQELRDGIREIIEEREYTPLELQAKSRGLWVRPATIASTKDSVKRSDAEYLDLARRYESGDKSVEAELRKAVDAAAKANGYVYGHAYHGTDYYKDITVFKRGKGGYLGSGIYFSDRQDTAKRYADRMGDGGKVYDAFLKIDNPLKVTSADPAQEILRAAYGNDRVYNERVRNQTNQSQFIQKKDITKLQSKGYDGIIWKLERGVETEYSVFDPEQIKSADLITKDDNGNIIPLSERFKTDRTGEDSWKNEDIRYSLKDTDSATLAGQMHEGAKGARALREQSERYNERIDELNSRIGKLNKRIADLKTQMDDVSLAERMHQGAEDAAALRKVRDEYNERIAQRDRLLEQVRKQRDAAKQHAVDVRKQERAARVRRDIVAVLKRGNDRIVKMLANPTENAHVPVQLAQAVSEYAQRLNELLTTSVPMSGENAGIEKQTKKGALNAQKIIDALNRSYADEETIAALKAEDPSFDPRGLLPVQYDENGHIIKDETLVKMINGMDSIIQGKHLTDLTEDELRFVLNTMRGVIHAVTEANKVTVDGESRNVYRTSRKMANELKSASKVFGNKSNAITQFLNRYVIESLGLRRIAKLYSGSDENATFVKMVDDLNQGAIEQERIKQTLRAMFNEVTQKYEKDMKSWYGKNAEWIDTGFGFKITKGMRVSLAMHILNAQNLRNVEKAGLRIPDMNAYRKGNIKEAYKNGKVVRLTKEQAQQIVDNMTEAEKAYFEVAKEFFHKRSGFYINRTSLKLLGYSKAVVDNYFPIQTDDAYRTVKYDDVRQTASVEHPGFLETRKGTANVMYLNDITAVVNRQIDGVAKYAGLAIPMRNWNNIMNAWLFEENENGEWVRSDEGRPHDVLENVMSGEGKSVIKYVDKFVSDLSSSGINDTNDVDAARFAAKLTSNYVKAVLTLNARVALSQLASVPTAAAEIPWKYIVQSFGGNVEGHLNRNASNDLIDQYTPIFAMRRAGTQTEVSEVMKCKGFADKAEQKLPGLLGWITGMDVAATRRLWYACERWVKGETDIPVGSDAFYKEVARRYNRVIQNTQPNFTVLQRSPVLRSKNAAARIITMFGTQRMQNAGVFIESLAEVVQTKDKVKRKAAIKKFGRTLSGLITAAIVIGLERALVSALRGRMRPLQDDDKDITVGSVSKYIMGEIGTSLAGSFMYVGEIYDFVHGFVSGITEGDSGYDNSFALPAADALSTMIKFFKNKDWQYFEYMRGDHTDNEKWIKTRSFINELMTVASYATGLPLANASKTILNGIVPLVQDIVESTKTGELNLYLHQSGKLDSAKTAANYKEWTNLGKKGSVYLAWENRFKEDTSNGLDHRAELLFEDRELSADEKAILLRMSNSTKDNPLTSKDGVVYKEDGTVAVDFTNPDRYRASTMLSDKQYEGFLNLVDIGVAEDVASTAFIQYNVQKKQGAKANDRFRDWLFAIVKNPEDRAKVDMAVIGNTVRVEGTIGYKENGEVYADYSSKEMFDLYTSGKKKEKSDAIISTTETPEAKAKAFADTDNNYHAKGGIVYNDKDKVIADFTSDEAYRASQMGESHYGKYTEAVKQGMSKENAILAVEKHKEFTDDDDKDNATQYTTWVFNTYKNAKDRAIAGAIYSSKPVTVKDGRTYDENGYIYRDYTSAAWYKLSNRKLSNDGVNKRYEAAKLLEKNGYTAEKTVAAYVELDKLTKKADWQKWLKDNGYTNDQIKIMLWSRGWAKLK